MPRTRRCPYRPSPPPPEAPDEEPPGPRPPSLAGLRRSTSAAAEKTFPWPGSRTVRRRPSTERTGSMTVEHLEELRHRIVIRVIVVAVAAVAGGPTRLFLNLLRDRTARTRTISPQTRFRRAGCRLVANGPLDPMLQKLKIVGSGCSSRRRSVRYQLGVHRAADAAREEVFRAVRGRLDAAVRVRCRVRDRGQGPRVPARLRGVGRIPPINFTDDVGFVVLVIRVSRSPSSSRSVHPGFVGVLSSRKLRAGRQGDPGSRSSRRRSRPAPTRTACSR